VSLTETLWPADRSLAAPAAILGAIEGVADGLAGRARLAGGAVSERRARRRAARGWWLLVNAVLSSCDRCGQGPLADMPVRPCSPLTLTGCRRMTSRGYGFSGAPRHPGGGGGGWEPRARMRAIRSQLRARGRARRLGPLPGTSTPPEVRRICRVRRGESRDVAPGRGSGPGAAVRVRPPADRAAERPRGMGAPQGAEAAVRPLSRAVGTAFRRTDR